MAINLMTEHGLTAKGWKLAWMRGKSTMGLCCHGPREIRLSTYLVQHNTEESVRLVMLHEIAHALVGSGHGHDNVWHSKCLSIGGDGQRCVDEAVVAPKGVWVSRCPKGHESDQHRAPLKVRSCGKCVKGSFSPQHIVSWTKNGRRVPLGSMPSRYVREALYVRGKYTNLPAGF